MTPDELSDLEAIRQTKARYFRLMDQKRWDEWTDVFCPDLVADTSDDGAPVFEERHAFCDFVAAQLEGVVTVHHGHMSEVTLTGPDSASAVTAMEDHLDWPPGAGLTSLWGAGWYEEDYRREADGQWRIARLRLRRQKVVLDGRRIFPPTGD
jgi:hypothetical protein